MVTLESRSLDADEILRTIEREKVTNITIVGDAFSKPIIKAIDAAIEAGTPYDLSSLKMIISSGVMWTAEVKEALLDRIEQVILLDAIGSSEGSMGSSISMKGVPPSTANFTRNPTTKVFTEDDREVEPGSDETGMVAASGMVPHRLLQGRGEVGAHVPHHRRRALLVPRRHGARWRPTVRSSCSAAAARSSTRAARRSSPKRWRKR